MARTSLSFPVIITKRSSSLFINRYILQGHIQSPVLSWLTHFFVIFQWFDIEIFFIRHALYIILFHIICSDLINTRVALNAEPPSVALISIRAKCWDCEIVVTVKLSWYIRTAEDGDQAWDTGLWSSLGTHGSLVFIWWSCISSSGEARKFTFKSNLTLKVKVPLPHPHTQNKIK